MNNQAVLDREAEWIKQNWDSVQETFVRQLACLSEVTDVVNQLPLVNSHMSVYTDPSYMQVTYRTEDPEATRSEVQCVLGVVAQREVNENDGIVFYTLVSLDKKVHVKIIGGKLAPGCELEPYEITETHYRVKCE